MRFKISGHDRTGYYQVSIPNYEGGEVVDAASYDALVAERDALKWEYESRATWIRKMNAILGYDNSDGFHSSPSPDEIAQSLVARIAELEGEWQPIESVPKDGTRIILGRSGEQSWIDEFWQDDGHWMYCDQWVEPVTPTHWRPIPAAPKEKDETHA